MSVKLDRKGGKISNRIGEPSSKYGYEPNKFEEDINASIERSEKLYNDFKKWLLEKKVNPLDFRRLFSMYYEEFISN